MLDDVDLEDLVVVFSQADGNRYLLVYNAEKLPAMASPNCQARSLDEIQKHPMDYASFDGPVVGLAAIDVILPDVPTHGTNFYSIEHIFRRNQKFEQLQKTSYRLAQRLLRHLEDLPKAKREQLWRRGCSKIIRLALPTVLARHPLENLVAVLPAADLHEYLDVQRQGYHLIYNAPLQPGDLDLLYHESNDSDPSWVVALEEVSLFNLELSRRPNRFIDLRAILRQMDQEEALGRTCRQLARRCWREWRASGDHQFCSAAYSLAAEAWLAEEDVEDLVALFPHREFDRFIETGDALRVYRVPKPPAGPSPVPAGPRYHIETLLDGAVTDIEYTTQLVCFPILAQAFKIRTPGTLDLGPILWKANRVTELARTFWLLSRDLMERPRPWRQRSAWLQINPEPAEITDLAVRAALIYSLSDPWKWRQGRSEHFLRDCYRHVLACLLNEEKQAGSEPLAYFYRALHEWYGCFATDDQLRSLNDVVRDCKIFQESCQQHSPVWAECEAAGRLVEIGESLWLSDYEMQTWRQESAEEVQHLFEVANYLRDVVDSRIPIDMPSKPFERQLRAYQSIRAAWNRVQESSGSDRPSLETMNLLLADYKRLQRVAYAPAHEQAVLLRACHADIERINRLKQAVETGPIIRVALKTPWVVLGIQETLILEIENVGGATAHQFKLDLGRTSEFELLTPLATHSLGDIAPARRSRLEYRIRAKESSLATLALNLNYSYRDHLDQQRVLQETLRLEVRRPRESGIKPKGNRYEVGRPVYGSGNFFGRHDETERVLNHLVKGSTQPILLRGPRRIGKTSLLRQIKLVLEDRQELQRRRLYSELETQLGSIHPVFVSLQSISRSSQNYVAHFLQTIVEEICVALRVEGDEQQISKSFERSFPTRAFMKQINRVFTQRPNERLLVLIDEWDEVYREEYSELGRNLRFLMQEEQRVSWVFSSTWTLSKEGGQYGSPFFNTLFTIELTQMDWPSAVQLVNVPSQAMGVTWHGEAVVAALEQTGRRPYLIQLLCSKIVDYLIEKSTSVVDTDTVAIVVNQIITQAHATAQYFGSLWNDEDVPSSDKNSVHWVGRLILWALDSSNSKSLTRLGIRNAIVGEFKRRSIELPDQKFFDREFDDQMTQLQWIFDVITLDNERYIFSIPLVQRWLHQMISQQDDLIDQAHTGLRQDLMKATGTDV